MTEPDIILETITALYTLIGLIMLIGVQVVFFTILISVVKAGEIFVCVARRDYDRAVDIANGISRRATDAAVKLTAAGIIKRGL